MSETLTEEEKQRIRVELVTVIEEIAEQFKIMKIMKIIQDDQLRSSNEANQERERSVKEEFAERFKIMEEQARRSEEAYVQRERIAREEAVDRFKLMEERVRLWSEEARIEMAAHLEKDRIEKAELEERIKIMEEQMRRSEEARIEMERWIGEEKDRKIMEEEQIRIREEEARIEKERAETEERERQEEENRRIRALRENSASKIQNYYRRWRLIVKAKKELKGRRTERKEKEEEERRLRIEADLNSLLALPYESRVQAYRGFNLEKRRELRINEELAEIELKKEYRYNSLRIERQKDHIELRFWNKHEECYDVVSIPISEIEKELEIMGKNTQIDCIKYMAKSGDRHIINGIESLRAKEISVHSPSNLNDADLRSLVENKEEVSIYSSSSITVNGLMWIYENMRDRKLDLKSAWIKINEIERWKFLDNFGKFKRESLTFTGSNHNQKVRHDDEDVIIEQDKLEIWVSKKDKSDAIGHIRFLFNR